MQGLHNLCERYKRSLVLDRVEVMSKGNIIGHLKNKP